MSGPGETPAVFAQAGLASASAVPGPESHDPIPDDDEENED